MQRIFTLLVFVFIVTTYGFSKAASHTPRLVQSGAQKEWCRVCGMSLTMFYKTSYIAKTKGGKARQYCSLHCLAKAYDKLDPNSIQVVEIVSERYIPASKAFFVVGSDIPGTMSATSKLAFATKKDAKAFAKEHGGTVVRFEEALALAKKEMAQDEAMLRTKKEKKIYKMGRRIYEKRCRPIDASRFATIGALKSAIKTQKLCKHLNPKQLQMVSVTLFDTQKAHPQQITITIPHNAKCPVCGMFVYKYPKWASVIKEKGHTLYFDGVKDLLRFYFDPMRWGRYSWFDPHQAKMFVRDYYTQKMLDAKEAFFVIGSDVLGPMGAELIPFRSKELARRFLTDHRGEAILRFDAITPKTLKKLDAAQ